MCVICISDRGRRQPTASELEAMFNRNPDGAGYMYARRGQVSIHKGFMDFEDFWRAVCSERFSSADPVVYHFRISTQAGVNPFMTQPFPVTNNLNITEALDVLCPLGVAHNGIIPATTDKNEKRYSDTALFTVYYLSRLIRNRDDLHNQKLHNILEKMIGYSKLALLTGGGEVVTIGHFVENDGLLLSNLNHIARPVTAPAGPTRNYSWVWDF